MNTAVRPTARLLSVFAAALLAVVGVLVVPTPAQAAETRVVCNHDWVRVRSAATTNSRELGRLSRGTAVTGTQQGSWFRLDDGRFVAAYYTCAGSGRAAAPQASTASGSTFAVCRTPWVRVRANATTRSAEVGRLNQGATFSGRKVGTWIQLDNGGHVAAYYACASSAPVAAPAPAPAPQRVAPSAATHQVCRTPWVRVRAKATTASAEIGRLTEGTPMAGRKVGSWIQLDSGGAVAAYYACAYSGALAPVAAPVTVPDAATPLRQPTGTLGSPTGPYGQRFHPILRTWRLHNGIDIGNRAGEPIVAAEAGTVTTVARDASAGLYVKIDHGTVAGTPKVGSGYLHMASAVVTRGQRVERGQVIGYVGNTGLSTKPHLHFMVYESGRPVNPEKYIGPLASLHA